MKFRIGISRYPELNSRGDLLFDYEGMFRPGIHVNADPYYLGSAALIEIDVSPPADRDLFREYLELLDIKFTVFTA